MISGGLHDFYVTDLCRFVSSKKSSSSRRRIRKRDEELRTDSLIARYVWNRILNEYGMPAYMVPNVDELFAILKYASQKANIIGCSQLNVDIYIYLNNYDVFIIIFYLFIKESIALKYGIMHKHQYLVSDVGRIVIEEEKSTTILKYVKIHNPHNKPDEIKR